MPAPPASASKATSASTCWCSSRRCTSSPTSRRKLQLKRGSHNLFMVKLKGSLEGPRPLRVSGKATFEILWCDFSVRFDTTLVKGERPPLPPAVNVLAQLTQALGVAVELEHAAQRRPRRTAWRCAACRRRRPSAPIVLDPLGPGCWSSSRSCRSTPARDIDIFGGAPVAGARRFAVTATLGGTPLPRTPHQAPFAPAQFFEMSDDEKLAAPSFESMEAGCVFGEAGVDVRRRRRSFPRRSSTEHVRSRWTARRRPCRRTRRPRLHADRGAAADVRAQRRGGAARRCGASAGRASATTPSTGGRDASRPQRWTIVPIGDGAGARPVDPSVQHAAASTRRVLKAINRGGARWQIGARSRSRRAESSMMPAANLSFPALGAPRRRRRHRHRRHAGPETARRCRRVGRRSHVNTAPLPPRAAAAARAGRRRRHRRAPGRAHRSASEHQRLRAELLSVDRIRPRRLPLAVHAGARQRERAAAAVAVPGGRAPAGRRAAREHARTRRCRCCRIAAPAKPFVELPDLKDSWAWAHGQAAADNASDPNAVGAALNGAPHLSLSRLVCPRLLTPNTDYLACVVPTFELGRKAGLGLADRRHRTDRGERARAGVDADRDGADAGAAAGVLLVAVPHRRGRRLRVAGAPPADRRRRRDWVSGPSRSASPVSTLPSVSIRTTTVKVEGALMPLTGSTRPGASGPIRSRRPSKQALADIVNQPGLNQVIAPTADPLLAPPLYGRWHAGRATVTPGAANWLDALNLDPRWRVGGGARHAGHPGAPGSVDGVGVGAGRRDPAGQPAPAPAAAEHGRRREPARAASRPRSREEMTLRFASPAFSRIRVPIPTRSRLGAR